MKKMRTWAGLLLALAAVFLAGCSAGDEKPERDLPPKPEEGVLIYAALNPITNGLQARVDSFNENHEDVRIEIRDYSDENGVQRLMVELSAGIVPDIMELHRAGKPGANYLNAGKYCFAWSASEADYPLEEYWMPYRQLAQKGYLEDLWPFIENDPDLGREGVLEAPLKAAEVDGGLYMLFERARIISLMGPERVVGDRYGWSFAELMDSFSTMPDDSTILRYNVSRREVFDKLLRFSLGEYVDWTEGECSFDSEEFRNMLEFLNAFPEEIEEDPSEEVRQEEFLRRFKTGKQMLDGVVIGCLPDVSKSNSIWGERAAFPGYPTADGVSGSFFEPCGNNWAMSAACSNKAAAWEFMRMPVARRYKIRDGEDENTYLLHINLQNYQRATRAFLMDPKLPDWIIWQPFSDEQFVHIQVIDPTKSDLQRFEDLINSTTQLYWPDNTLSDIVWEALGPYFAGDKTMDTTITLLQDRVSLYVNEQK